MGSHWRMQGKKGMISFAFDTEFWLHEDNGAKGVKNQSPATS